jgi:hypothetical protein
MLLGHRTIVNVKKKMEPSGYICLTNCEMFLPRVTYNSTAQSIMESCHAADQETVTYLVEFLTYLSLVVGESAYQLLLIRSLLI